MITTRQTNKQKYVFPDGSDDNLNFPQSILIFLIIKIKAFVVLPLPLTNSSNSIPSQIRFQMTIHIEWK